MKNTFKLFGVLILFGATNLMNAQCAASFTFMQSAPGNYSFTSTSTGTSAGTGYSFDFGNGQNSGFQTNTSASTTYTTNQIYTVTMYLSDSTTNCFASSIQTIAVNNVGCNFSLTINHVAAPSGLVYFSTNAGNQSFSYSWNFGDNNTSSLANPAHTYSVGGVYTVTLTAITAGGLCNYTTTKTITVSLAPCALAAGISFTQGTSGLVNFSSASSGTTNQTFYAWNFGDGSYAYTANPSHTYLTNNMFIVSLTVSDSSSFFCTDTASDSVNVSNAACINLTNFTMSKDSTQNLTWNAYPFYPSNISNVTWNWGDGSSSNSMYPTHTYSAAGIYTICLSATVSCGTATMFCLSSSIFKPAAGGEGGGMVTLNVQNTSNPTGIIENRNSQNKIRVFPNPSSGMFNIVLTNNSTKENITLEVSDLLGKIVYAGNISSEAALLDLSTLQNGIYIVKAGNNSPERLLIQR